MNKFFNDVVQFYDSEHISDSLNINNLETLIKGNFLGKIDIPISLKKCVLNEEKVILYINEGNCGSCIEECLIYLSDLGNKIGRDKIVLLGNFHDKNTFDIFKRNASVFIENSLFCPDLHLPEKFIQQPVLFILDKNLNMKYFFVPDYYPEYNEEYFTKLIPNYFNMRKK